MKMERYYRILDISSSASKEEIKKAYHQKMKALHPDKMHGTPLEDAATFFSSEINEAYNALMSQYNDKRATSPKKSKIEYLEEDIFISNRGYLRYSLSNDLSVILNAITKRAGYTIHFINLIDWAINIGLSENVKTTMNKYDANYSMTTYDEGYVKQIIINKRGIYTWYVATYEVDTRKFKNETPSYYDNQSNKQYQSKSNNSSSVKSESERKAMGNPYFSKALYNCALECCLRRRNRHCRNRFDSPTCNSCRLYVKKYIDASPRDVDLFMLQADMHADSLKQASSPISPVLIIVVIFIVLLVFVRKHNYQETEKLLNASKTPTEMVKPSQYKHIDNTLSQVSRKLQGKADVNNDRLTNCIDAAVLFYQYYPNKNDVCIMLNRNSKTEMNHLFNVVRIDGNWRAVEPQSYWLGYRNYWMRDVWKQKYDYTLNRDVTQDYLRYVR